MIGTFVSNVPLILSDPLKSKGIVAEAWLPFPLPPTKPTRPSITPA